MVEAISLQYDTRFPAYEPARPGYPECFMVFRPIMSIADPGRDTIGYFDRVLLARGEVLDMSEAQECGNTLKSFEGASATRSGYQACP